MNTLPLGTPWDISLDELNNTLRAAGVKPIVPAGATMQSARHMDMQTRVARVTALCQSVCRARESAPPIFSII
jgi:hypothetical protein